MPKIKNRKWHNINLSFSAPRGALKLRLILCHLRFSIFESVRAGPNGISGEVFFEAKTDGQKKAPTLKSGGVFLKTYFSAGYFAATAV